MSRKKHYAVYIDIDKDVCAWTRELIKDGFVMPGEVMCASIKDIDHETLRPFTQVHAFSGIAVWAYALRQAGWPEDRKVWSGSAPCQPFSVAGRGGGTDDPRHLWPDFFRLIDAARPPVIFGEQVSGKAGYGWFDGVAADLESKDYACWAYDIPACAVDAPHIRNRLYWGAVVNAPVKRRGKGWAESELRRGWDAFTRADAPGDVADAAEQGSPRGAHGGVYSEPTRAGQRLLQPERHNDSGRDVAHPAESGNRGRQLQRPGEGEGPCGVGTPGQSGGSDGRAVGHANDPRFQKRQGLAGDPRAERAASERADDKSFWADSEWVICHDGKARRTKPGISLLASGTSGRISMWRALGNAICAPLAIEVIKAFMESERG